MFLRQRILGSRFIKELLPLRIYGIVIAFIIRNCSISYPEYVPLSFDFFFIFIYFYLFIFLF